MSHNPHTPPHQTHFLTVYDTYNTPPPYTHTFTFHLADISHDVGLICGLILGQASFRALLIEGLIVCQLPGCQIRHVGSQPGFSSLPFMFAQAFFFPPKSAKLDWYAASQKESCTPYLSDRTTVCKLLAPQDRGLVCGRYSGYYTAVDFARYGLHL